MSDKWVREDEPAGERGAYGARWKLAQPRRRGDQVEVYGLRHDTPTSVRLSILTYPFGTNEARHAVACLDNSTAVALANEILRLTTVETDPPTFTLRQRRHLNATLRRLIGRADLEPDGADSGVGDRLLRLFDDELSARLRPPGDVKVPS